MPTPSHRVALACDATRGSSCSARIRTVGPSHRRSPLLLPVAAIVVRRRPPRCRCTMRRRTASSCRRYSSWVDDCAAGRSPRARRCPYRIPPPPAAPAPPPSPPRRWHTLPILRVHRGSHAACSLPRVHVGVRPGRGHRRRKFGFRGGARLRDAIARNVIVVVVNVIRGGRGLCTDTRHRRSRRVAMAHDGRQIVVATARVRGRVVHRRRSWDEKRRRCRDDVREHIRRGGVEARCGVLRQRRAIDRPIFEERRRGGGGGGVPAPRR